MGDREGSKQQRKQTLQELGFTSLLNITTAWHIHVLDLILVPVPLWWPCNNDLWNSEREHNLQIKANICCWCRVGKQTQKKRSRKAKVHSGHLSFTLTPIRGSINWILYISGLSKKFRLNLEKIYTKSMPWRTCHTTLQIKIVLFFLPWHIWRVSFHLP